MSSGAWKSAHRDGRRWHLPPAMQLKPNAFIDEATSALGDDGPWFLCFGSVDSRGPGGAGAAVADEAIAFVRESLTHIKTLHDKFAFVYACSSGGCGGAQGRRCMGGADSGCSRRRHRAHRRHTLVDIIGERPPRSRRKRTRAHVSAPTGGPWPTRQGERSRSMDAPRDIDKRSPRATSQ